jgi:protein O-GlcNAc transferase
MLKKSPSPAELNHLISAVNYGDFATAEAIATPLSKSYPKATLVWKILGVAIAEQDRIAEAIVPMQKVVQLEPKDAEAHRNLATALKEIGQLDAAETHFRKAIALNANDPLSYVALAKILNEQKNYTAAEKYCRKAIDLKYDIAEAHDQLGIALLRQLKETYAEACFNTAILLNPEMADAYNNLGIALNVQKKYAAADASYRQALKLNPEFANAYGNLGNNYIGQGLAAQGLECLQKAISLKPNFPEALCSIGDFYISISDVDSAIAYYRKVLAFDPSVTLARNNILLAAIYSDTLTPESTLLEAKQYGAYISAQAKPKYTRWHCPVTAEQPSGKIRIGFVSGDLRRHSVIFFLEGLLRNIDKHKFELIAYTTQTTEDEFTALVKPHFIKWQPIHDKTDQAAAELIHHDALHILVDIAGHTAGNRLPVFAYKPAPIQVSWLGYPATTGLPEMDYMLGDSHLIPATDEAFFVEKIWHLPNTALCFNPLHEAIPIAILPALSNRYITFGCFNNLAKMTDRVVTTWAAILHALPTAKLYLQALQLNKPAIIQKVYDRFAAVDIAADRLILEEGGTRENYFRSFNKMDIALDPFPCNGGTTSVETLWMGVPVLTIKKQGYSTRISETIAHNVGLAHWVAEDTQDYINKAIAFASDLPALAKLRGNLQQQVLSSPLFDAPGFSRQFETAVVGMLSAHTIAQ